MTSLLHIPNSPLEELKSSFLENADVKLYVKREDLIHPYVSGNKWRKLKYNILEAKEKGFDTILTFGGAFSNHIYSTAAAGKLFGINTIGIIRGEENLPLNPTLSFASDCGMKIVYLSRERYREKEDHLVLKNFEDEFGPFYYVPEGGSNNNGVKGCEEIITEIPFDFDVISTACGTGGTISGLINSAKPNQKVLGFCALKGTGMLDEKVRAFITNKINIDWEINYEYHFGGYAKINSQLISFMDIFETTFQIKLEPVYTGKMFYGLFDLIQKGYFPKGIRIVALHTGGLQGLEGMKNKMERLRNYDISLQEHKFKF